jgi:Co/Zn/Cd efflux system component
MVPPSLLKTLYLKTPQRHNGRRDSFERQGRNYERLVAAAAATFFAALAAFAAVEALRRLFVFGGVAGASPMSSAVIMLVTNSFGP